MTKYRCIAADPPWNYPQGWPTAMSAGSHYLGNGRVVDNARRKSIGYDTMTLAEIAALPVGRLVDPAGCRLFLWTTNRYLAAAFSIMAVWGFTYSQTLVWAKTPMGMGPGGVFVSNVEYLLVGKCGNPGHKRRIDTSWFNWPRTGRHSRKPEHAIDMIESVCDGPYMELFSRRKRIGWDALGVGIDGRDIRETILEAAGGADGTTGLADVGGSDRAAGIDVPLGG